MAHRNIQTSSDSEESIDEFWSSNKRKKKSKIETETKKSEASLSFNFEKFEKLKAKSAEISRGSALCRQKTELRKSKKFLKKVLRDPCIKAAVDGLSPDKQEKKTDSTSWNDVKPFLTVNNHLAGPVPHGSCGPKMLPPKVISQDADETELESLIDDSIKDGDFEKAELLSDTLANREFAVKIAHAFDAKKYHDRIEQQKEDKKLQQLKKIQWTFCAKERWQMKGNM